MVLASRSQLALSSGVVAAIWPRICKPTRKSDRLKAASASLRSVADDLATGPASLLIWASSLTAESARSSRLKALSAARAAIRPSASVAQITVARTKPIMMELLAADISRVTSKNARKGDGLMAVESACEKVACMALAVQTVPAAPAGGGHRRQAWCQGADRSDGPPSALVANLRKSVRPVLAGKRIFHIGSARKDLSAGMPPGRSHSSTG